MRADITKIMNWNKRRRRWLWAERTINIIYYLCLTYSGFIAKTLLPRVRGIITFAVFTYAAHFVGLWPTKPVIIILLITLLLYRVYRLSSKIRAAVPYNP